jgi:hypothetical protein
MAATAPDAVHMAVGDGEAATPISRGSRNRSNGRATRLFQQASADCDARNDQRFKEAGRRRDMFATGQSQRMQRGDDWRDGGASAGIGLGPRPSRPLEGAKGQRQQIARCLSSGSPSPPTGIAAAGLTSPGRDDYIDLRPRLRLRLHLLCCLQSPTIAPSASS